MKSGLLDKLAIFCLISIACTKLIAQPVHEWTNTITSSNNDGVHDIITDASGNVYATGYFTSSISIQAADTTIDFPHDDDKDIFLVKFSSEGNFIWAHVFGGNFNDEGYALATDNFGNVYMTGYFSDEIDFDPSPDDTFFVSAGLGVGDIFITKYDPDGNFIWGFPIGDMFTDEGRDIVFDPAGFIYLSGGFVGTVDSDPGPDLFELSPASFASDIFLAKYDLDGNLVWAENIGGTSSEDLQAITLSNSGNLQLTGGFSSTTDLDPSADLAEHASLGYTDLFLASYDTDGNYLWSHSFGSTGYDISHDLVTDASNNIYMTGNFWNTVNFSTTGGTTEVTSVAQSDMFLAKFASDGTNLWAISAGGPGAEESLNLTYTNNEIYVTGVFSNSVDFDPSPDEYLLTSGGYYNIYLTVYDPESNLQWAGNISSAYSCYGRAMTSDESGRVYLGGEFQVSADFDPDLTEYIADGIAGFDGFITQYGSCNYSMDLVAEICYNEAYLFDGVEINTAGTYIAEYTTASGCDSIITLALTVQTVDIGVTESVTSLTANNDDAVYQWVDCLDGFEAITGATYQEFIPGADGTYAVIITENGCTDTSDCYLFEKEETNSIDNFPAGGLNIYPNPSTGFVNIEIIQSATITILSASGQLVYTASATAGIHLFNLEGLAPGIYYVNVIEFDTGSSSSMKIIRL
jgi:hypothetical protein